MKTITSLEQASLLELREMILYHNIIYKDGRTINKYKMNKEQLINVFIKLNLVNETISIINRARTRLD